ERDFEVLSTGYNTAYNADDPVNNLPANYHVPIPAPDPIVAADHGRYAVIEGGTLSVPAENGVLQGAFNAWGDPLSALSVQVVEPPHHGTLVSFDTSTGA